MSAIPTIAPILSLSGHDAYCHVCWEPYYSLWVDTENAPSNECLFGHKAAHDCPQAMGAASLRAFLLQLPSEGVATPPADASEGGLLAVRTTNKTSGGE
jgi:hypothetical protein